ncbi:hypothetical protein [Nocardioides sp. LML1-1-1.1]|uniref:hypothetical protein n=1 Tax=Nocardioides sp. LML1-1-1.1 TaxID=3135248 RepID=UPI003427074A
MSEQQARPVQATLAGGLIIGGSVLLIALAWERVSLLHTLDVRESVEEWLRRNELSDLSVEEVITTIRVLCIVGAGAAAAAAILGFQVFRRSASARFVLAGLAPLLLLGGVATSTPLGILAVLGVALLWAQPTRDWYAGRPWAQRYEERREQRLALMRSGSPTTPPAAPSAPHQEGQVPPPPPAFGLPPERPLVVRRPGALKGGCVLTWVLTPLVALSGLFGVLRAVDESGQLFADLKEQQPDMVESSGMTEADVVAALWVLGGALVLWCVAAAVLAALAWVGQGWARIVLAVSGVGAALLALLLALSYPPVLVLVVSIGLGVRMLLRPEVAAWYRLRRTPGIRH